MNTTEKCNHVGFWIAGTPVRCDLPLAHSVKLPGHVVYPVQHKLAPAAVVQPTGETP